MAKESAVIANSDNGLPDLLAGLDLVSPQIVRTSPHFQALLSFGQEVKATQGPA
jgi:hypothetical protein